MRLRLPPASSVSTGVVSAAPARARPRTGWSGGHGGGGRWWLPSPRRAPRRMAPPAGPGRLGDDVLGGDEAAGGEEGALTISVVVPALNEEANVRRAVESARGMHASSRSGSGLEDGMSRRMRFDTEVIVVDGGSGDDTMGEARRAGATHVVASKRGRANQCNAGAGLASGDILLFLHADSTLPPAYDVHVRRMFSSRPTSRPKQPRGGDAQPEWGAFRFSLSGGVDDGVGGGIGERIGRCLVEWGANLRTRFFHMPYGDQGLIVRKSTFDALGGFRPMCFMEDFELVRRLRTRSRPVLVPAPVTTSARRWDTMGVLRVTLINQAIVLGYVCGVPLERLSSWYKAGRHMGGGMSVQTSAHAQRVGSGAEGVVQR